MKIYGSDNNIYDAVDEVLETGVAVVSGTKTPAVNYANRIIQCLNNYPDVSAHIGYQNVCYGGYYYYVYDLNRFLPGSSDLKKIINKIDEANAD